STRDWSSDVCSSDLFVEPSAPTYKARVKTAPNGRRHLGSAAAARTAALRRAQLCWLQRPGLEPGEAHQVRRVESRRKDRPLPDRSEERRVGKEGSKT